MAEASALYPVIEVVGGRYAAGDRGPFSREGRSEDVNAQRVIELPGPAAMTGITERRSGRENYPML